jgi:hypothetical protein
MKLIETNLNPSFVMQFTQDEVTLLDECAKRHYDHACKQLAERGGEIFSLKAYPAQELNRRIIELFCKVLQESPDSGLYQELCMLLAMADDIARRR